MQLLIFYNVDIFSIVLYKTMGNAEDFNLIGIVGTLHICKALIESLGLIYSELMNGYLFGQGNSMKQTMTSSCKDAPRLPVLRLQVVLLVKYPQLEITDMLE